MSSDLPDTLHPVILVEDRYQGVYSGGRWWAVARGDEAFEGRSRLDWLVAEGPGADDVTCAVFWGMKPPWIESGPTPDAAIAKLVANPDAATDDWTAPTFEDDPRSGGWLNES